MWLRPSFNVVRLGKPSQTNSHTRGLDTLYSKIAQMLAARARGDWPGFASRHYLSRGWAGHPRAACCVSNLGLFLSWVVTLQDGFPAL